MRRLLAIVIGSICVLPFALMVMLSFARSWFFPAVMPELTLAPWIATLTGRGSLLTVLVNSLVLSLTVALASTVASYVTARYVSYHPRRALFLTLAYAPYVMSPVILGVCILYLYIRAGIDGTGAGVVLAQTIFAFSFGIIFFSSFWNQEKRAFEDLVSTLGGSSWDAYRRVLLPLSRDSIVLCVFQTFLISWFQYGLTMLIGEGKVQTLPMKVFDYLGEANVPYAAVASCLLAIPPVALLWINRRMLAALKRIV